jgi:putative ABC transport system substrate-binding protein
VKQFSILDFGFSIGIPKSKKVCLPLGAMLLALSIPAQAQQPGKLPEVGVLEPGAPPTRSPAPSFCTDGFRQSLHELGYVERQNILFDNRYAEFKSDRLRDLAVDLARSRPTVIWTHSLPGAQAARQATNTIPIVVGVAGQLVDLGLVASLARPGGNITGLEHRDEEIMGKRLELLKETLPTVSRVAVLVDPTNPQHARVPGNIEAEARSLRVQFRRVAASAPEAFEKAFADMVQGGADAVMIPESAMFSRNRRRIFELATSRRLPTAAGGQQFAEDGSLLSYGANIRDTCRRSAVFVDKILKGSKPADLPVERPTKFELVFNLKTAKQIGVTIPPNVLARADKVIR